MLNSVKYIKQNGLEQLLNTYNLVYRYSTVYPNLIQLCYHQLDTPKNEITNECRGLILDTANDFKVVSYPFYRFSDYSERADAILDLPSLKFFEKLDGSIITLYYYDGEWKVSTKTTPDAHGMIYGKDKTYRDSFLESFKNLGYEFPSEEDRNKNFVFEYLYHVEDVKIGTHFVSQGITSKPKDKISLLMVRELDTFQELDINLYKDKYELVESYDIESLDIAKNIVKDLDPILSEGFVIMDKNYNRFKLKSPQFDKIAELKVNYDDTEERQRAIESSNFRKLCEIVRTNNHKSFLKVEKYKSIIPQHKKIFSAYKALLNDTQVFVNKISGLSGKELGMKLKGSDKYLNTLAFNISQGKIDKNKDFYLEDYFYQMNIRTFEEIIKSKIG